MSLLRNGLSDCKLIRRAVSRNKLTWSTHKKDAQIQSENNATNFSETSHGSTPVRSGLADEMRKMNLADWSDLLRQLLAATEMYLCRVHALHQHLLGVIAECASTNGLGLFYSTLMHFHYRSSSFVDWWRFVSIAFSI